MYKIERTIIVKVCYAEYLLTTEKTRIEKEIEKFDLTNKDTYRDLKELRYKLTQLEDGIKAIQDSDKLPF